MLVTESPRWIGTAWSGRDYRLDGSSDLGIREADGRLATVRGRIAAAAAVPPREMRFLNAAR